MVRFMTRILIAVLLTPVMITVVLGLYLPFVALLDPWSAVVALIFILIMGPLYSAVDPLRRSNDATN